MTQDYRPEKAAPKHDEEEVDQSVGAAGMAVARRLREAGVDEALQDARLLVEAATGLDRPAQIGDFQRALRPDEKARLDAMAARREAREPMAHILQRKGFWTLELETGPEALVPRPETEHVVEEALSVLPEDADARILDLGVGSGAILLSLLSERSRAWGVGVDRSIAAAQLARRNAQRLGLAERAALFVGDWDKAIAGAFDVVVSNPPYVKTPVIEMLSPEVRADPRLALDGGADGLSAYRAIIGSAHRLVRPGGALILETGADQAREIVGLIEQSGAFEEAEIAFDLNRIERVVAAQRRPSRAD